MNGELLLRPNVYWTRRNCSDYLDEFVGYHDHHQRKSGHYRSEHKIKCYGETPAALADKAYTDHPHISTWYELYNDALGWELETFIEGIKEDFSLIRECWQSGRSGGCLVIDWGYDPREEDAYDDNLQRWLHLRRLRAAVTKIEKWVADSIAYVQSRQFADELYEMNDHLFADDEEEEMAV